MVGMSHYTERNCTLYKTASFATRNADIPPIPLGVCQLPLQKKGERLHDRT